MPKRPRYNETRPLTLRVTAIRPELDARSDGSESGYRAQIMHDLTRYYELMNHYTPSFDIATARALFMRTMPPPDGCPIEQAALDDALNRALTLYTHAGLSVDDALRHAGMVEGEGV